MAELDTGTRLGSSSISDICLLVQDLERAIEFYRDRVGFKLRRLAPGFADFFTAGVTLALWQVDHMQTHLQLPPGLASKGGWRTMAAVQVENRERVHAMHFGAIGPGCSVLSRAKSLSVERLMPAISPTRKTICGRSILGSSLPVMRT